MTDMDLAFYVGNLVGCLCTLAGVWMGRRTA